MEYNELAYHGARAEKQGFNITLERPVKIGRFKFLANRLNNFIKAALVQRHIHRQPPPAERSARGKPDGGADVSGDGLLTRARA